MDENKMMGGYVVMTQYSWGWGTTLDDAKAQHRKAGGSLTPGKKVLVYKFDADTEFCGVTDLGSIEYMGNSPTRYTSLRSVPQ